MGFISGAILGLATLVFLLMAFNELTDSRYTPRGAGWLFIPIGLGFAMASYAPLLWLKIEKSIAKSITSYSKQIRLVLAAVILWISSVGIYVYLFEPYGYITSIDRVHLVKVIIFPIAICFVGLFIYKMILKKTK